MAKAIATKKTVQGPDTDNEVMLSRKFVNPHSPRLHEVRRFMNNLINQTFGEDSVSTTKDAATEAASALINKWTSTNEQPPDDYERLIAEAAGIDYQSAVDSKGNLKSKV